ncbi:hypothetical protein M0R45_019082 [Rubus argutus]|uniref:Uncharacterized protein n=1 Tax=Rubus argutus TaxID=59490 RepID=A0AAW1X6C2_RUBAR
MLRLSSLLLRHNRPPHQTLYHRHRHYSSSSSSTAASDRPSISPHLPHMVLQHLPRQNPSLHRPRRLLSPLPPPLIPLPQARPNRLPRRL